MQTNRTEIRLALPSKGRLAEEATEMLERAGLGIYKPNPRQYQAVIPALPGLSVLFQRPADIVTSVRDGSVDFGLTGWDVFNEMRGPNGDLLPLLPDLGFGRCTLNVIVPEAWEQVQTMADLRAWADENRRSPRVATKFPVLTQAFFTAHGLPDAPMISAEGTLEIAPTIGYADLIVDLVSTGATLRENRLRPLQDGEVLRSQACLVANKTALKRSPETLAMARQLLEFIVASMRGAENLSIFANLRGDPADADPQAGIARRMFAKQVIGGLQGPTFSPVLTRTGEAWYAVHLIVRRDRLARAITELREIGGSGVIVAPVTYIFEEEPEAYRQVLAALEA